MADSSQPPAVHNAGSGVVVVIPCFNEGGTIARVVKDFRAQLPNARVLVVDNASQDDTVAQARQAGAEVVHEPRRGKGRALCTGFGGAAEAAWVVMVDGDDTYPADRVVELLERARAGADMVVGTRLGQATDGAFRPGHALGNRVFAGVVRVLFGIRTHDLLSGYRVLNRRLLDGITLTSAGFEVESELAIRTHLAAFRVEEVAVAYRGRPAGSFSKLKTMQDGVRILGAIVRLFVRHHPAAVVVLGGVAGGVAWWVVRKR